MYSTLATSGRARSETTNEGGRVQIRQPTTSAMTGRTSSKIADRSFMLRSTSSRSLLSAYVALRLLVVPKTAYQLFALLCCERLKKTGLAHSVTFLGLTQCSAAGPLAGRKLMNAVTAARSAAANCSAFIITKTVPFYSMDAVSFPRA